MPRTHLFARASVRLFRNVLASAWLISNASAASLLLNPGFEADPPGENQNVLGWQLYGANHFSESNNATAHTGNNYFKVYQAFNGATNFTGAFQDYISGPGAVYSADGWAYTDAGDALIGLNTAWIEVSFRDANANLLALYKTAAVNTNLISSGGFPKSQWNHLQITNQCDVSNGSFPVTNTVTELIAPPGTAFLRYQLVLRAGPDFGNGSIFFDDLNITLARGTPYGDMNITWTDEFDGNAIKNNIWTYDTGAGGWGNNELETYTTTNSFVTNGLLHIVARKVGASTYTSARMKSQGLYTFTYGRVEWRAQLPYGVGFWPALWLLGANITSSNWPSCGEVDVLENTGTNAVMAQSSIHYGGDGTAVYNFPDGGAVTNFHTYTFDWTPNAMLFYVDGHLYQSQTGWNSPYSAYPYPFNRPFFLLMNFAIGGNYVQNPPTANINANTFPAEMLVDYVRVYNTTDPFRIAISQTSSNLVLTWPSNIVCSLQAQTDAPPNGIGTNWFPVSTTTNKMFIVPVAGSAFFRLTTP